MTRHPTKYQCCGPDLQEPRNRHRPWAKNSANKAKKSPVTSCHSARPAAENGFQNARPKPRPPRAVFRMKLPLGTALRVAAEGGGAVAGFGAAWARRFAAGAGGDALPEEPAFCACSRRTFAARRVPIPSLRPKRTLSTQKKCSSRAYHVALFRKAKYGKKNATILARGG